MTSQLQLLESLEASQGMNEGGGKADENDFYRIISVLCLKKEQLMWCALRSLQEEYHVKGKKLIYFLYLHKA